MRISFQAGRRRLTLEANDPKVYTFQDPKCGIPQEVTIQIFTLEAQTEVFQGHVELAKSEGLEITGLYLLNNLRVKQESLLPEPHTGQRAPNSFSTHCGPLSLSLTLRHLISIPYHQEGLGRKCIITFAFPSFLGSKAWSYWANFSVSLQMT